MTRRIVIGATAHAAYAAGIAAARPDLAVRHAPHTAVTADDLAWADTYVGFRPPPTDSLGNVRWVHVTGAGVDAWLFPEPIDASILLTRSPESFGAPIAEWAIARALMLTQRVRELEAAQRERAWRPLEPTLLAGARVLVVGTGDIGTAVAARFAAFGCTVTGVSRSGAARAEHGVPSVFARLAPIAALPELVGDAQFIVLTLPLTEATYQLFDRLLLSRCRGAVLLNAGRGAVVEEDAIVPALDAGWLSAAALDVFETEPLPAESALWGDPRVIVSPHCSGPTTVAGAVSGFLECLAAVERGEVPKWVVDRSRGY